MIKQIGKRHACSRRDLERTGIFSLALVLAMPPLAFAARAHAEEATGKAARDNAQEDQADDLKAGQMAVPRPPEQPPLPQVETIIPDSEFNAAIPAIDAAHDDELDKPFETIEQFEARLASKQADAKPEQEQEASIGNPALADGTSAEQIGDAPVRDAELNTPLPSLDQFEVTPVEIAEGKEAATASNVPYSVKLEGLDGLDNDAGVDLAGEFRSHSALHNGKGKAANVAMVNARLSEDAELLSTVLASQGWYSPQIRTRIDRSQADNGLPLTAVLAVDPGKRYVFSDIVIQADPTEPAGLISDNLALRIGEPIVADRVQGAEAQVAVVLPANGYPFAKVGDRDILLDRETGGGVYTLPVEIGPRSRFGGFATDGKQAFGVDHIAVLSRFERGELYNSRKVDDLRKALVATSLFNTVTVEPQHSGEKAPDGTEYVTLQVHQEAGPPRTIAGSLGYAAGEGATAEVTWTHRNMFPPEGALIGHGVLGTAQQDISATLRRSNAGKRDRTFELIVEAFHNDYDAYSAYTGRIAARISRDSTNIWQKRITYAYGAEALITGETDYNFSTGTRDRHFYTVAGVNGQIGYDRTESLLDPTKGFRVTALLQPETTVGNGFTPYFRARLEASSYYQVVDGVVLAGRVRFGTIQGAEVFDIAPSRRLYAGGGGSVRGYSYQGLGEQAPDGKPVGGRSLNEASAEIRYRFGNYGVVAFIDAGQAYRETMPQLNDLRYGVGIGGRFYTNFGPMRLDVATPLGRKPGESLINVYVSIGQSF